MNILGIILLLGIGAFVVTLLVSTIRELIARKRSKSGEVSAGGVNNDKEKK